MHHHLGPGLLEAIYEDALCHELSLAGFGFQRQPRLSVTYKGHELACRYVIDLIIEDSLIIEIKAVTALLPVHEAQLLTYRKVSYLPLGLLLNFNEARLKDGIRRRRL